MIPRRFLPPLAALVFVLSACGNPTEPASKVQPPRFLPGARVLLDAHNCYPYHGQWANRMQRALDTGVPLAIEQDLVWFTDSTGNSWSVVAHNEPFTGEEPALKEHFFERVRPIVEKALQDDNAADWPLITLNLDFKSEEPEHLAAIWRVLGEYESWLSTAERLENPEEASPIEVRPLLVLTGESDAQQAVFHDQVPVRGRLLLFGAVHVKRPAPGLSPEESWEYAVTTPPQELIPEGGHNYRRWWNNSWFAVEEGGTTRAGDWIAADEERLRSLVRYAHDRNLWIRFYTLNGHDPADESNGWSAGYNFGSPERAEVRRRAAVEAGADFIATDQYEDLAKILSEAR